MNNNYQKKLGLHDIETGEIIDGGIRVYIGGQVKWRENWFMGIQRAFIALAKDKEIAGRPRRVLDYLFGKLGFENYICITQTEISKELEIARSDTSNCIKLLLEKGVILQGPKLGRVSTYRLNTEYGWRGKIKNLSKERYENSSEMKIRVIKK